MSQIETIKKSFAAGFLIGMAGWLFVRLEASTLAAFIFAFALFFICILGLDLFTGKIGWLYTGEKPWWYYPEILVFNLLGTAAACALFWAAGLETAAALSGDTASAFAKCQQFASGLIDGKLKFSILALSVKGFLCGIMMYLAVAGFKKYQGKGVVSCISVFLAIPVFILSGFEHSIADAAYMFIAGRLDFFLYVLLIALFNGLGSVAAWFVMDPGASGLLSRKK